MQGMIAKTLVYVDQFAINAEEGRMQRMIAIMRLTERLADVHAQDR